MKAMVLAAGLGTRLRPLTADRPKALVEVAGRTMLEITLARLRSFAVHDVIVNVHYFADSVIDYLRANHNFGMHIEVSREDALLLDTGGGLRKAAPFFLDGSGREDEPFLLHNVDVISTTNLQQMVEFHQANRALATLAVRDRNSSRYLLFNNDSELCGRQAGREEPAEVVHPCPGEHPLAFSGIHVISIRLLKMIRQQGVYSIIDTYLDLAARGERILAFRNDDCYWMDLGRPENVAQASREVEQWSTT
jgi:NDP-sugar pyrophosphorylase family protein